MSLAWIGLGANLGRPERSLKQALIALESIPRSELLAVSPSYWTAPWGVEDQPEFLNAVACLKTELKPLELLRVLLAIETGLGRKRDGERWGPRELDLDLLLVDQLEIDEQELSLPHPRLHERAFVLLPLADLAPDLEIPGLGTVTELLEALPEEELDGIRPAGGLSPAPRP
ncbi:MAG: 2-amino-4-hydroxy-6-hydroxymethyldihydropteridine diphosphokinase [Wenzhouxiangella sp.]